MPVNCVDFLKKVKTKKLPFALLGKGTAWKFYTDAEVAALLNNDKLKEDKQLFTGKAEWKGNKFKFAVDGEKDDAKKALKAAYTAEKIKWEETAIAVVSKDEEEDGGGPVPPPVPPPPSRAAAAAALAAARPAPPPVPPPPSQAAAAAALAATAPPGPPAPPPRPQAGPPQQQAPARPQAAPPTAAHTPEYAQFMDRLQKIMPQVRDVAEFDPTFLHIAQTMQELAANQPGQALNALAQFERKLESVVQKNKAIMPMAQQLRLDWEKVTAEGLERDGSLIRRRDAVRTALAEEGPKQAVKALLELQKQITAVKAARDESRKLLIARWLFRNVSSPRMQIYDAPVQERISKELGLPPENILDMLKAAVKSMVGEGENPAAGKLVDINPLIPPQTRPSLTKAEAAAVTDYAAQFSLEINQPLWTDGVPPPPHDESHRQLQAAFKKTKPFPNPIVVNRGLTFKDPAELKKFMAPLIANAGNGKPVALKGYISTGTLGVPRGFVGNVEFRIIAKQGLDVTPYVCSDGERELLLNHNEQYIVHKCSQKGTTWLVTVEQIIPKDRG